MPDPDTSTLAAPATTPLITEADVRHVATLSRLRLSDDEVHRFTDELADVLDYIGKIDELDLAGVEPLSHPLEMSNVFREDEPKAGLPVETVLSNAPAKVMAETQAGGGSGGGGDGSGGFFEVPKVLEESSA